MSAVWLRARSELRSRLLAVLALAGIVGVMGAVVIATIAGARRTETAYPRLLQAEHAMDIVVDPQSEDPREVRRVLREVDRLPQVAGSSWVSQVQGHLRLPGRRRPGDIFAVVSPDGGFGTTVNGVKILHGRMYGRHTTDEIVPSFPVAHSLDLHVGETVELAPGGLFADQPVKGAKRPAPVPLHVVGIGAIPNAFQPLAGANLPIVLISPGFYRAHADYINPTDLSAAIRLRHGPADSTAFRNGIKRLRATLPADTGIGIPFVGAQQTVGVEETTRVQATSLWVVAALVAVAGLAIFGQALARQTFLESIEYPTLRSLGMSPDQLFVVGMIRAGVIGVTGGIVAAGLACLASPLLPTGTARIAEPHPGFAFDGVAIGLGAAGTVLLVSLLSAIPAWRASRAAGTGLGTTELRGAQRPSGVGGFFARAAFPPSATAGVRMAFEPGRGRTAVPVRTTIFGATLGILALAAALGFGSSLDRLVSTPSLSGWNWDVIMFARPGAPQTQLVRSVERSPDIAGYSVGTIIQARAGNQKVLSLAMEPKRGSVTASLVDGRLPQTADEIALGTETLRKSGAGIGDTVPVRGEGGSYRMRVVGRIVMPSLPFSFTRPGQGAVFSLSGADRVSPERGSGHGVFARFTPGIDQSRFLHRLKRRIPGGIFVLRREASGQINNLNQVGNAPLVLAGILALMAAATLAHTLITSIRRRRLDLAILKTLGFVRGQVSATVAWQATALAAVAVLIGLPLGVISGRWSWNVFADRFGVVPQAVVPVATVLIVVPVTIVVANLLALLPGRIASRLKAASVMRSE